MNQEALQRYGTTLLKIETFLRECCVKNWPDRLADWQIQLRKLQEATPYDEQRLREHLTRSRKATGGMGSLGDIFISPSAGDCIADNPAEIAATNSQLKTLIHALYEISDRLLSSRAE